MIEELKGLPRGIDGAKAIGTVSKEDYELAALDAHPRRASHESRTETFPLR